MFKKQRLLAIILVFMLALTSVSFAAPNDNASMAFDQKAVAKVSAERAMEHIKYLSEEIGTRPGGLEGEWKGAEYIKSVFESYGYDVEMQPFSVGDQNLGKIIFPNGKEWETNSMSNSLFTDDSFVEGEVVFVEGGLLPTDFSSDVADKIVLLERASTTAGVRTQVSNAVAANVKGVIIYSVVGSRGNYGSAFSTSLSNDVNIPVLGAAYIQGVWLKEMLAEGEVSIKIQTRKYTDLQSLNVIATKPAKNKDANAPVIVIGGHMDSVVGAPGANDNASGVALTLELARVLKGYNTDKEIRFMAFGSEERGLLGARHYVNQLNSDEKSRIIGMFSADMVATSYPLAKNLYSMTVDGSHNAVTEAATAAGTRLGNSDILPGTFGSSDHVPFHQAGIPSALFIWMGIDSWNPLVYHIEKVYHTPQDTIEDNVSVERLQSALDIIGAALFDLARKEVPALEKSKTRN